MHTDKTIVLVRTVDGLHRAQGLDQGQGLVVGQLGQGVPLEFLHPGGKYYTIAVVY